MTNDKVSVTLNWQDQNCHLSFLTATDSIISLSILHENKTPLGFSQSSKHNQKVIMTSIKLVLH